RGFARRERRIRYRLAADVIGQYERICRGDRVHSSGEGIRDEQARTGIVISPQKREPVGAQPAHTRDDRKARARAKLGHYGAFRNRRALSRRVLLDLTLIKERQRRLDLVSRENTPLSDYDEMLLVRGNDRTGRFIGRHARAGLHESGQLYGILDREQMLYFLPQSLRSSWPAECKRNYCGRTEATSR